MGTVWEMGGFEQEEGVGCQESWLQLDSSGLRAWAWALIHFEERGHP